MNLTKYGANRLNLELTTYYTQQCRGRGGVTGQVFTEGGALGQAVAKCILNRNFRKVVQ